MFKHKQSVFHAETSLFGSTVIRFSLSLHLQNQTSLQCDMDRANWDLPAVFFTAYPHFRSRLELLWVQAAVAADVNIGQEVVMVVCASVRLIFDRRRKMSHLDHCQEIVFSSVPFRPESRQSLHARFPSKL